MSCDLPFFSGFGLVFSHFWIGFIWWVLWKMLSCFCLVLKGFCSQVVALIKSDFTESSSCLFCPLAVVRECILQ